MASAESKVIENGMANGRVMALKEFESVESGMKTITPEERDKADRKKDRIRKLKNFENRKLLEYEKTIDFRHPFSCKLLGCRGSGKTTFMINYLNTGVVNEYEMTTWVTTTDHQDLLRYLNDKDRITFLKPEKTVIDALCAEIDQMLYKKRLIIFDDSMLEDCIKNNKKVLEFYTGGRHKGISTMSLEQHISISHNVEKGNTDYYLLFQLNDYESLDVFRKKFACEYQYEDFIKIYNYCIDRNHPLIVSLATLPKFRFNFNEEIRLSVFGEASGIQISRIMRSYEHIHTLEVEESRGWFDKFCLFVSKCLGCCCY